MAPKGKRAAPSNADEKSKKAKTGPANGQQQPAPGAPPQAPGGTCINAEFHHLLGVCESKILDHYIFEGVAQGEPTCYSGIPAYNEAMAAERLGAGENYTASCPFFWLNLRYELQPNVPKYRRRIDNLKDHFFAQPGKYPQQGITVSHIRGKDELPHMRKGHLRAVCPPELRDAFRLAIAEDVDKDDAPKLKEWLKTLLSVPFHFTVIDEGHPLTTLFGTIVQQREDIGVLHENMRLSSLLRSYEVMDLKSQLEASEGKQNKTMLAEYYKKIKYSQSSEAVSVTFVEASLMLHNNVLCVPEVRDICFKFDNIGIKNPLDSVHKYRQIAMGCESKKDTMVWVFQMTWDWWNRTDGHDSISIRVLRGDAAGWGGKSLVHLFLNKLTIRNVLIKKMDEFNWDIAVKENIKELTKDVETCRSKLGFHDDPDQFPDVDLAERGSWPLSADKFLLLFEILVYGYTTDVAQIKSLQQKKGVEDFFDSADVSNYFKDVKTAYAKETKAEEDSDDDEETAAGGAREGASATASTIVNQSVIQQIVVAATVDPTHVTDDVLTQAKSYSKQAERNVKGVVKLVSVAGTMEEATAAIKKSSAGKVVGKSKSYVVIVLDAKILCEAGSQARWRSPPTRANQLSKLIGAVVAARCDDHGGFPENDVFVGIDGNKGDFEDKIAKAFHPTRLDSQKLFVIYTQESIEKRLDRPGGNNTIDLMETVHLMTSKKFQFKVQPRKLLPSQSTRANVLGPLAHASLSDSNATWTITWGEKKELYSMENLPLPGGQCPGAKAAAEANPDDKKEKIKPTDLVPAFYHEGPASLAVEVAHLAQAAAIIDLTPGSGHWAMHAIRHRVPYVGLCFTEKHVSMLYDKLISRTLDAMLDGNDKAMYDATLASVLTKHKKEEAKTPQKDAGDKKNDTPPKSEKSSGKTEQNSGGQMSRDELLKKINNMKQQQNKDASVSAGAAADGEDGEELDD